MTLGLALLLSWVEPAACPAQSPAPKPGAAAGERLASPPTLVVPLDSLPSTVSPSIERFMREEGRNLPPPPPPLTPAAARRVGRQVPSTSPPPGPATGRGPLERPSGLPGSPARSVQPRLSGRLTTMGPAPAVFNLKLKPAPLESNDLRFPINLATALRLADARPLVVAAAQTGVWYAEAELTRAKLLWVPTLIFAVDYIRHDGGGPDFNKGIMTAPSVNYFHAGGGTFLFVNVTDIYFQPLIQRQVLNARHWDVQASKNDAVMQTADAYFRVHQYRGMYAGALYNVEMGRDLVDRIANLSEEFVSKVEVERARNFLAELEQRAVLARQEWRVASADLTQILRLDPRAVIVPMENDHAQITLIDPGRALDDLMPIALMNRPELAQRRAEILAAQEAVRREKLRPLLPIIATGGFQTPAMYTQIGIFGLGPNSSLNQYRFREDVTVQLIWQLEGFGIGNLARIKAQRGNQSRTIIQFRREQDKVVAEVTRAQARLQSAAARVLQADRALRTGIITFKGHLEGLEQTRRLENMLTLTFRPQEAVYSLDLLSIAFDEYFTTVAEYNRAQFDLFHAMGYPARELTVLRDPGPVVPVNTARPGFLPPVGNGPPPATR